jgi:hypothetical protein
LWQALRNDDPGRLLKGLEDTRGELDLGKYLVMLERKMWKNDGKRFDEQGNLCRGVLGIAAGNDAGVPPGGAVKCLAALLQVEPAHPQEQLDLALEKAIKRGRDEAASMLLKAGAKSLGKKGTGESQRTKQDQTKQGDYGEI